MRPTLCVRVVAAAVLLCCAPIPVDAQIPGSNRIQNGDFETCDLQPGWEARQPITFDGSVTRAQAHTGACSLELRNLDIIQQTFGSQGVTHQGELTFWALAPTLPSGACLSPVAIIEYADGARNEHLLTCTTEWTEVSQPLDRGKQLRLIGFSTLENGDVTLYIDDVAVLGLPPEVVQPPQLEDDSERRRTGLRADLCRFVFRGNETLCILALIVATLVGLGGLLFLWRRFAR